MKKLSTIFLAFFIVLLVINTTHVSAADSSPTGLLIGKTISTGTNTSNPIGTTTAVTDNNLSTSFLVKANVESSTVSDFLIYSFTTPQYINAVKLYVKDYAGQKFRIGFLDKDGKHIYFDYSSGSLGGTNDIQYLSTPVNNVVKAYVWNSDTKDMPVIEWDLYGVKLQLSASPNTNGIDLNWNNIGESVSYTIKRSLTAGGPYETIASNVTENSYYDTNIDYNQTYYYTVEAVTSNNAILTSNEATAKVDTPVTPTEPSGNRAILTITMTTGLDKEFDLSMEEVNAFISWYETKEAGSGTASYAIDKHENNKGPFSSRKDYVIFKNILSFEVDEYSTTE